MSPTNSYPIDEMNISMKIGIQAINDPITALPQYNLNKMPTNYKVKIDPTKTSEINPLHTNFYTDGSCTSNPGKGAFGWYTSNFQDKPHQEKSSYTYPITIINCESMAVLSALTHIKNNSSKDKNIIVFTDWQTLLQFLNFQAYPK